MRTPLTSLPAIRSGPSAREILVRFLRRERGEILESWSRALSLAGGALSHAASPPPDHPSALAKFLSLFERHLGDPFFRGNFYYLRRLILRGSPAEFPLAEEVRALPLLVETFPLGPCLEEALLAVEPGMRSKRLRLERHLEKGLPPLRADRTKTRQILVNLLSNAVRFTPPGGRLTVAARAVADGRIEDKAGGWRIHVSVIDTGVGIPRDRLGHLFGDPAPLRRWPLPAAPEGMGLGLAIVRHLVELHGGRIWTRSTVNTGSRFTFTLPAACPPP